MSGIDKIIGILKDQKKETPNMVDAKYVFIAITPMFALTDYTTVFQILATVLLATNTYVRIMYPC